MRSRSPRHSQARRSSRLQTVRSCASQSNSQPPQISVLHIYAVCRNQTPSCSTSVFQAPISACLTAFPATPIACCSCDQKQDFSFHKKAVTLETEGWSYDQDEYLGGAEPDTNPNDALRRRT
ncbi:hypothetical protein OIU79_016766 [Salix purpurea]|uniref:Uncharacterized protein n=1 Tax=Salix purpurea TaxID=77065 RepID=A0A9Q0PFG2_SALPP|nr:hypothetical protein OIU79_016766 [Salix purpurea]